MGERFAARIARHGHLHQARIHRVLDVTFQDAILDQGRALRRIALVVDIQGAAPASQGAVVDHGDALGRHALADASGKRGRTLAVEIAFQAMADRLVQQDAGPARSQHDGHGAGGRGARFQVHQGRVDGICRILFQHGITEIVIAVTPAATSRARFAAAILLRDHGQRDAHQRADVGRQHAVAAQHQHHVVLAGQARHHLHDSGVFRPRHLFHALEQLHLGRRVQRSERVVGQVQRTPALWLHLARDLDSAGARARDGARGRCRF